MVCIVMGCNLYGVWVGRGFGNMSVGCLVRLEHQCFKPGLAQHNLSNYLCMGGMSLLACIFCTILGAKGKG